MLRQRQTKIPQALLCVALSVVLHMLLAMLIVLLPPQEKVKRHKAARKARPIKVVRSAARNKAGIQKKRRVEKPREQKTAENQQLPFAKTSPETPQMRPDEPEYEGKRDTRAASAPDARHLASAEQAPAMNGEEKQELVTFDQDRQEGPLEHEGKTAASTQPPAPPQPPADGRQQGITSADTRGQDAEDSQPDVTKALTLTDDLSGQLKLQAPGKEAQQQEQEAAQRGLPGSPGRSETPLHSPPQPHIFYDPSLAEWAQKPGFRTNERRSRSSGRFVFGRGAALNVLSTPRGAYEAMVYRRVAHFWYIACDEHRGDIIPGKITISLRITRNGQIDSMALIKRSGASISQQSFTFKAIRKASLPPMPPEVQADVIGKLMELIFEFNFD